MPYVLVKLKIGDVATWRSGFEAAAGLRKQYGSRGVRAFQSATDPNEIIVLGEYDDLEKARELFASEGFRQAAQKAGVQGPPQVTMLTEVMQLPS